MAVFDGDDVPEESTWAIPEIHSPELSPKARSQITYREKMLAGYDVLVRELIFTLPDDPLYEALRAEVDGARAELLRLMGVPPQYCHEH